MHNVIEKPETILMKMHDQRHMHCKKGQKVIYCLKSKSKAHSLNFQVNHTSIL